MKVILLTERDLGLARPRPAGSEVDVDATTAAEWIAAGDARPSEKELMAKATNRTVISKPAKPEPVAADAEGKAKS